MKLNIELKELELTEANVVLAALQALQGSKVPVVSTETTLDPNTKDADGLVWDERIHSSNHKMNSDGRWQRRRNIDNDTYVAVRSELLGVGVESSQISPSEKVTTPTETPAAPNAIPATPLPAMEMPVTPMAPVEPVQPVEPVVPMAPATPATPATPAEPSANDLYTLMFAKLQAGFRDKKVDANYIQNTVQTLNTMFGTNWTGLGEIKDNAEALKVVIDQLTKEGL